MKIKTSRFGEIEIQESEIINFAEGILGFEEEKKFSIIDPDNQTLILWLQSLTTPEICFPILEPSLFITEYNRTLVPSDLASIKLENNNEALFYNILTIPSDIQFISANLKAPIVINPKLNCGKQIVLQDNKLDVKHPMYKELKKAITMVRLNDANESTEQIKTMRTNDIVRKINPSASL